MSLKPSFLDKLLHRLDRVGPLDLQTYLQRLNKERGFFETIFNALYEGILVVDQLGRIEYLNRAVTTLLGIESRALGTPISHYLRELDWPSLLAEGRVVSRDLEIFYPQPRFLNFYLVPLAGREPAVLGFALIFHDLTTQRAQTTETIQSEKLNAVMLLAAGVAHELGNPLNSLNIHLQLLERDLRAEAKVSDAVLDSMRIARSEVTRLDTIINQFLRALRPGPLVRHPCQINEVVRESLHFLQPEITDRDVLVEADLTPHLPHISAHADQLKQAFYNLIKNAIQAMSSGGILRVTTRANDTHVLVEFTDNGPGVSVEDMAHLTEPYFTRKKNGSGLGLFIVQRIIHEHGGDFEVMSEPGRGTTARISLPLTERRVRLLQLGPPLPPPQETENAS